MILVKNKKEEEGISLARKESGKKKKSRFDIFNEDLRC